MDAARITRLGLVVHPVRELSAALETIGRWSDEHGVELVQVPAPGQRRSVAALGDPATCDAIVALGGDGTALAALRAGAAAGRPVIGVACGSLGALTAVTADELAGALDRLTAGDWTPRMLPALVLEPAGGEALTAVNDIVLVRHGAGQIAVTVRVDGELFIRFAGDGLVVATPFGSSGYTFAVGGPLLAPGSGAYVLTPLSAHGGCCPPLVLGDESRLAIGLEPGPGGARIELDGQVHALVDAHAPQSLAISRRSDHATLVTLGGGETLLAGLRRRRLLIDSPRLLARDDREAALAAEPESGQVGT